MNEATHAGEIAGTRWNPQQYLKFSDHRLRPALELLARIPLETPETVVDLGCGAGNVTLALAKRWPAAQVYGLDNSMEMLAKARATSAAVNWREADAATWQPDEPVDIVYSNATLHWVDNHARLFPRLVTAVRKGGCLAVQMPRSWDLPSHRLMREVLADHDGKGSTLGAAALRQAVARRWVDDADRYYDLLSARVSDIDIWETEYLHLFDGEDPVLEWVHGTGLRPILKGLDDDERNTFLHEYRRRLKEAYPSCEDGRTLYHFRRLFIVALV